MAKRLLIVKIQVVGKITTNQLILNQSFSFRVQMNKLAESFFSNRITAPMRSRCDALICNEHASLSPCVQSSGSSPLGPTR